MLATEMHLQLDLELQRLNSNVTKNFLPQEKDWFLNKEVDKFILSRLDKQSNRKNTGFQETAIRIEDLQELVKVQQVVVNVNNRGESYIDLPSDYLHYIRFDSYIKKECIKVIKEKQTYYKTTVNLNLPITAFSNYKITLTKEDDTTQTLFETNSLPDGYLNTNTDDYSIVKQHFLIKKALFIKLEKALKEQLSESTYLFWDNSYSFTVISDVPFKAISIINLINNESSDTSDNTNIFITESFEQKEYPAKSLPIKSKIRVINEEFLTDVVNSSLSKSVAIKPLGTIRNDKLILPPCESAIIGKVDVIYICRPNLIDVHLNSNLELKRSICRQIVSNTVRFIKAIVEDRNYQQYAKENVLIE